MAYIGDLSLGYLLGHTFLSFPAFSVSEKNLGTGLSGLAGLIGLRPDMLAFLIYWLVITHMMIFANVILFGLSPFQLLAGFRTSGPWWLSRIGGGARVLIDMVIGPFLIFELPLLKGKPTLKEKLTGSLILRGSAGQWRLFLVIPILLMISITAPLFKDFTVLESLVVSFEEVDKAELEPGDNFAKFNEYASDRFKLKTFTSLDDGRFSLYPDFEIVKVRAKRRISPFLLIYDHENKTAGELKVRKRIALLELLKLGVKGNPFFARSFPALAGAISLGSTKFKERDLSKSGDNSTLFNPMVKEDIKRLVQASFELGLNNIVGHILTYGPFLRGFIEVRQAFSSLIKPGVPPEVDILSMGNMDFLRFRQSFSDDIPISKQVVETYIPLGTNNALSIELAWDKTLQGALSGNVFRKSFLARGEWFFDYENFFTKPHLEAGVNAFYAIDLLNNRVNKQRDQEILEEFLHRHYYQSCRRAIMEDDERLFKVLKTNIMRLSSIMNIKNDMADKIKEKDKSYSSSFLIQWRDLWTSLRSRDRNFFNI